MHKWTSLVATVLIGLLFTTFSTQTSAQPVSKIIMPAECDKSDYKNPDLDKLAADFSTHTQVHRVQKSIVVRLRDQGFFDTISDELTPGGKQQIAEIARDLSCYPDTSVYIQVSSGSSVASKYLAEEQAFLVQTALRNNGVDINRLDIDLATPSESLQSAKIGGKKEIHAGFFELEFIPQV